MLCREAVKNGVEPFIDYDLLRKYEVWILGKKIDFDKYIKTSSATTAPAPKADEEVVMTELQVEKKNTAAPVPFTCEELIADKKEHDFLFFYGHDANKSGMKACLSQWFPAFFFVDNQLYNCAEQYMMAAKARLMGDEDTLRLIMTCNDQAERYCPI